MDLVDWLLTLTAAALWLTWRASGFAAWSSGGRGAVLRLATPAPSRRWIVLAALGGLLLARAWVYQQVGPRLNWVPHLDLGAVTLPFNSVAFVRMAFYSVASFLVWLGVLYLWLLLLSVVNRRLPEGEPVQRWVRLHLGWVEGWPTVAKVSIPGLLVVCLWYMIHPALVELGLVAAPKSVPHVWEQGATVGLSAYLVCRYLIGGVLFLHVVNSYLYLGNRPLWSYVHRTASTLLGPLRALPLKLGAIDLAPVVGIALVFGGAELGERLLAWLFTCLPL